MATISASSVFLPFCCSCCCCGLPTKDSRMFRDGVRSRRRFDDAHSRRRVHGAACRLLCRLRRTWSSIFAREQNHLQVKWISIIYFFFWGGGGREFHFEWTGRVDACHPNNQPTTKQQQQRTCLMIFDGPHSRACVPFRSVQRFKVGQFTAGHRRLRENRRFRTLQRRNGFWRPDGNILWNARILGARGADGTDVHQSRRLVGPRRPHLWNVGRRVAVPWRRWRGSLWQYRQRWSSLSSIPLAGSHRHHAEGKKMSQILISCHFVFSNGKWLIVEFYFPFPVVAKESRETLGSQRARRWRRQKTGILPTRSLGGPSGQTIEAALRADYREWLVC